MFQDLGFEFLGILGFMVYVTALVQRLDTNNVHLCIKFGSGDCRVHIAWVFIVGFQGFAFKICGK